MKQQQNPLVKCFGGNSRKVQSCEIQAYKLYELMKDIPVFMSLSDGAMRFRQLPDGRFKVTYYRYNNRGQHHG